MIKIFASNAPWHRGIDLLLVSKVNSTSPNAYGTKIEFETPEHPGVEIEPTIRMDYDNAQNLMDELWSCGLRPTEGSGSAGALAATQKHLDDMRKLVFDYIQRSVKDG